jgi:hypothetical protein
MKLRDVSRHDSAPAHGDTRHQQGPRDGRRSRGPCGPDRGPPAIFWGWRGQWAIEIQEGSGSVNRFFRLLGLSDSAHGDHMTGFMIADAVRYMSVHSWTQWDSHGLSGTLSA